MSGVIIDVFLDECIKIIDEGAEERGDALDHLVFDHWIKDKRYNNLLIYLEDQYDTGRGSGLDYCLPRLTDIFIKEQNHIQLRRLWGHVIRCLKQRSFSYLDRFKEQNIDIYCEEKPSDIKHPERLNREQQRRFEEFIKPSIAQYLKSKARTKRAILDYDMALSKIGGAEAERVRMKELLAVIESDKKPKPKKTTDKRKMDESIFWVVINEARTEAEFTGELPDKLRENLECMTATAIKKFDKLFRQQVGSLYHWNLWALAYLIKGGCGDDAFEYFCAGLILQGKETVRLAKNDLNALGEQLKVSGADVSCEQALAVAENAYVNKTGNPLPYQNVDIPDISGKEWSEKDLPVRYPKLYQMFK